MTVDVNDEIAFLDWASSRLGEINPSNYDHDDVCDLNARSLEVILAMFARMEALRALPAPATGGEAVWTKQAYERLGDTSVFDECAPATALPPAPHGGAEAVAEVVWYDPSLDLSPLKPRKIIDASLAFMDTAPIGTKLYAFGQLLEEEMKVPFIELPDDLREPLHSLQADLDWLFARVAADGSMAGAMKDSVRNRLSQIETASYRLTNPSPPQEQEAAPEPTAAAEREAWPPIETAPKGLKVLAGYWNELGNWRTVIATYFLPGTLDLADDAEETEDGFAPEGWYEESETHETLLPLSPPPTHWMPLPTRARKGSAPE